MELGDDKIKVSLASIGFTQASGLEMGVNAMSMFAGTQSNELDGTRVLQLLNMVTAEDLIDNEDYEGLNTCQFTPVGLTDIHRNLRRRHGRVPKVRTHRRDEGPSSFRRQSAIRRSRKDFLEI